MWRREQAFDNAGRQRIHITPACLDERNRRARNRADQSLALLHSALPEMVNNHQIGDLHYLCETKNFRSNLSQLYEGKQN